MSKIRITRERHVEDLSDKDRYVKNCLFRFAEADKSHRLAINISHKATTIQMNGYAIIPIEEYRELEKLRQEDLRLATE